MNKDTLIMVEDYTSIAKEILAELGVIEICEICGYYTRNRELEKSDYAKATEIIKNRYEIDNYKLFHSVLKSVVDECTYESIEDHIQMIHYDIK